MNRKTKAKKNPVERIFQDDFWQIWLNKEDLEMMLNRFKAREARDGQ